MFLEVFSIFQLFFNVFGGFLNFFMFLEVFKCFFNVFGDFFLVFRM